MFDKLFTVLKAVILNADIYNPIPGDWVSIGSLPNDADLKGADDQLHLTLLNVEEERILKSHSNTRRNPEDSTKFIVANPEIKLNLYVLVSAYFRNYAEALKRLAYVIRVFQQKNVFSPQDIRLVLNGQHEDPPVLDEIIVDLYSQSLDQQYQFFQSYGHKQVPSVIYKIRLLVIDELPRPALKEVPSIITVDLSARNK